jgi:hypothetical protein
MSPIMVKRDILIAVAVPWCLRSAVSASMTTKSNVAGPEA